MKERPVVDGEIVEFLTEQEARVYER